MKPQISLLVPFRAERGNSHRADTWNWLKAYWAKELPEAEIVIGRSKSAVFNKSEAVNAAAKKARGRIFVILDADAYIPGDVIRDCADRIEDAKLFGHNLWFVPYRHLYRLTESATRQLMDSSAESPVRFSSPPRQDDVLGANASSYGHHFGAMIQIMSRDAFRTVGGMDERMHGWGGEDISFVRLVDTLWGKHKTVDADVLHLWHPNIGVDFQTRKWEGQVQPGMNNNLSSRYNVATGDRQKMLRLAEEARLHKTSTKSGWCCRLWHRLLVLLHLRPSA